MKAIVSLKCPITKATYLRNKITLPIETNSLTAILNIRIKQIGSRAVIQVSGVHQDQITRSPLHKIALTDGKNQ